MLFFERHKKEEDDTDEGEEKKPKKRTRKPYEKVKNLSWGRKERIFILAIFLLTIFFSLFFAIRKGNFKIDSPFGKTEVYQAPSHEPSF